MAYVAISGSLLERVKTKIAKMEKAELDTLGKFDPIVSPSAPFVGKTLWGDFLHLRDQMPNEWKSNYKTFVAEFMISVSKVNHTFTMSDNAQFPPTKNWYTALALDTQDPDPNVQACVEHYTKVTEVQERWKNVENNVFEFLQACKSLNEAVKTWPDVVMYVAEEDVERMGVKREKARESEALKALASMDTDALVGAAVIARMSGAAVQMNHNLKEKMLPSCYQYSQKDVAEKMFLAVDTIRAVERRAIEKFKKGLVQRGIKFEDLI